MFFDFAAMRNDLRGTQAQRRLQDDRVYEKFNENGTVRSQSAAVNRLKLTDFGHHRMILGRFNLYRNM